METDPYHSWKRKSINPLVYESFVTLRNYEGDLRQVIVRGTGREEHITQYYALDHAIGCRSQLPGFIL